MFCREFFRLLRRGRQLNQNREKGKKKGNSSLKKNKVYLAVLFMAGVLLSACGTKSSGGAASAPTGYPSYTSQEDSQKADIEGSAVISGEDTETEELYFQKDGKDYEKVKDLIDGQYHWASAVGEGETIVDSHGHERPDYYTQPRWFVNLDRGESLEVRRWDNLYYSAGDYLIYEYNGTMYVAEKEDLYHPVLSYPVEGTYGIVNKVSGGYMVANNKEYKVVYYDEKFRQIKTLEGFRAGESGNYYRDGLLAVRDMDTGLMGFLDEEGEVAIPCQYGYVSHFSNGFSSVLVDARLIPYTEDGGTVQMFGEAGGYWAVIDTEGNYAVAPSEAYANKAFGDERDLYCGARRFSEARSDGTIDFLDISPDEDDKVIETIRIK